MKKEELFKVLSISGSLFLITATILVGVLAANQIKERNYIGMDLERDRTITVSGEGEIFATPDFAKINFSVISEADTADKAMEENSQKMNSVVGFLKNQGIDEGDLKTTRVNVYPRYEYQAREVLPDSIYPPDRERTLVSYEANQSLEVKIKDLENAGSIIEGAISAGANRTSGLVFDIEDQDELKKQAREKAIRDAENKARELENQLGVKLRKIVSYNEDGQMPYLVREMAMDSTMSMDEERSLELEPGENQIKVRVSIGYEIGY